MSEETVREILVELIDANPFQPRREFDEGKLLELAESIRSAGLHQPVVVRPHPQDSGRFELVSGERRLRATKRLEKTTIQAIVRDLDDDKMEEVALIENVQRADLTPIEEADAYQRLLGGVCEGNVAELCRRVGKTPPTVESRLKLLTLHSEIQKMVNDGRLTLQIAGVLTEVEDPEDQMRFASIALKGSMDTNRLRGLMQGAGSKKKGTKSSGKNGDASGKPATHGQVTTATMVLMDLLDRLNMDQTKKLTTEQRDGLSAQLGALVGQIQEEVLPKLQKSGSSDPIAAAPAEA